jgi:hypothetical protein
MAHPKSELPDQERSRNLAFSLARVRVQTKANKSEQTHREYRGVDLNQRQSNAERQIQVIHQKAD